MIALTGADLIRLALCMHVVRTAACRALMGTVLFRLTLRMRAVHKAACQALTGVDLFRLAHRMCAVRTAECRALTGAGPPEVNDGSCSLHCEMEWQGSILRGRQRNDGDPIW